MKKITIFLDYNPFVIQGASSNRWRGIINTFIRLNFDINIVICNGFKIKNEIKFIDIFADNVSFIYLSKLPFYNVTFAKLSNFLKGYLEKIALAYPPSSFCNQINDQDFILIKNAASVNFLLSRIKVNNKVKIITEINEQYSHSLKSKYDFKIFKENIVPRLDEVWSMTRNLIFQYKELGVKKECNFEILPMSVDMERFKVDASLRFNFPYIFYAGALNDEKDGVAILIEAFALIHSHFPDLKLVLGGWYFEKMVLKQKKIISHSKIEDKVIYTGALKREEIPTLMKSAEINCLARPISRQATFGFPTKLGEYLSSGRPVCVTSVGEIPNYLENKKSAVLVEPGDASAFAEGLKYLLSDPEQAKEIGENGIKVAIKHFSLINQQKLIKKYMNRFNK